MGGQLCVGGKMKRRFELLEVRWWMETGSEELGGLLCVSFNDRLLRVDNNELLTGMAFHESVYRGEA